MSHATPRWQGWQSVDGNGCKGGLVFKEFEPKAWDEDDVDVQIMYCGICGSDAAALAEEWGPIAPGTICGHEIVGVVARAGSKVDHGIKLGDIVGIGAESDSCRECDYCKSGFENNCSNQTITFGSKYHRGNAGKAGSIAMGGFAKYWRGPSRFAVPVPKEIDPAVAGPLFCGGVTVYSPLSHYGAGTKAKRVGILGVGGLGHMGIMFAKAMGAEVTAISRSDSKKEDAEKLGATKYIATGNDVKAAVETNGRTLDLIICTINPPEFPDLVDYLKLLTPYAHFVLVGVVQKPLSIPSFGLIQTATAIAGSNIGSVQDLKDMLAFAAKHNIRPWVQKYNMDDINKALPDFKAGKPRYRFVLVNTDNGGKM